MARLVDRYVFEAGDAAALMDLSIVEQLFGNLDIGLARQEEALGLQRLYRTPCAGTLGCAFWRSPAPAISGPNTPIEFLLGGSDIALTTLYVVPGEALPETLPDHTLPLQWPANRMNTALSLPRSRV